MLIDGIKESIQSTQLKRVAIAGGVSANSKLRKELQQLNQTMNVEVYTLPLKYCTDNAAMIGIAGYYKYLDKKFASLDFMPVTRWEGFSH